MDREIELAKSLFILAQILIILAGFLFATSGIAWTNAQNTVYFRLNLAEVAAGKNCGELSNISNYQEVIKDVLDFTGEIAVLSIDLWKICGLVGIVFVIFSIFCWWRGRYELKKINKREIKIVGNESNGGL